jgi:hypothetical protein
MLSIYDHADLSSVSRFMNRTSILPSSSYVHVFLGRSPSLRRRRRLDNRIINNGPLK